MKTRKKIGLALGSGGPRGIAHVGVIKTLIENNIPIDYIAGTSIGAWVGACFALYYDIETLEKMTLGFRNEKLHALLEPSLNGGLVKGNKVYNLLKQFLTDKNFSDLQIPLCIIATNFKTGQPVELTTGNLAQAVQASMAIPFIFKPIEYRQQLLTDGGLTMPLPCRPLKNMGADIVIAIDLEKNLLQKNLKYRRPHSITSNARFAIDIMRSQLAHHDLEIADIIIQPELAESTAKPWRKYFFEKKEQTIMSAGASATKEKISAIKNLIKN